jgi:hypothetical protein
MTGMSGGERRAQRRDGFHRNRRFDDFFVRFGSGFDDRRGPGSGGSGRRLVNLFRFLSGRSLLFRLGGQRAAAGRFFNCGLPSQTPPHQQSLIVFQRTGVGLLLRDAQLGKHVDYRVGLHFQLPGQLVDANFTHTLRL